MYEIMQIVTDEVNNYLFSEGLLKAVQLDNIAVIDQEAGDTDNDMSDCVVLTMLNMDEEKVLKNFPNTRVVGDKVSYQNNKINLNLYILFSANKSTYDLSLKYLSKVIEFFQGKRLFTQANSNYDRGDSTMELVTDFHFTVELYTPTFEELNYIWGTLGGKQYPSALYKLSMIEIERNVAQMQSKVIDSTGILTKRTN